MDSQHLICQTLLLGAISLRSFGREVLQSDVLVNIVRLVQSLVDLRVGLQSATTCPQVRFIFPTN